MGKKLIQTQSTKETQELGRSYGEKLRRGGVLLLFGDLGSGKTTFTQGFAKGLSISRKIISPTFLLMRTYDLKESVGKFYHIDLYRIGTEKEIEELGIPEVLGDSHNVVVIEWAERMGSMLPAKRTELHFEYIDSDIRQVEEVVYD